jgi:pSer/pThr/pTyr-binding forkhead associated (FHA) protein
MCRDLGSMNGTCVNQVRIEDPVELLSGDLLTVGSVTFRVDCADNPPTLSDNKDETEVASRQSDLEQLLKIPEEGSASSGKSFESCLVKHNSIAPAAVADGSHPTLGSTVESAKPENLADSEKRSDPCQRNPR